MKKDLAGNSVQDYLLGNTSTQMWWAIIILANVMVFIMMGNRVNKGIKLNDSTPDKFHLGYFLTHNLVDILRTEASIYLMARVSLIWVDPKYVLAFSIFIGLISDQLITIFLFVKDQGIVRIKKQVIRIFGNDGKKEAEITTTTTTPPGSEEPKDQS